MASPEEIAAQVHGAGIVTIAPADSAGLLLLLPDRRVIRGALTQDGRVAAPLRELRRTQMHRVLGQALWAIAWFGAGAASIAFIGR